MLRQNWSTSATVSDPVREVVRTVISGPAPATRLAASTAIPTTFSGLYVQFAKSEIDSLVVGVARTVRGGAMRSRSHRISSFDSSSSGTQSMARSAVRTASSIVDEKTTVDKFRAEGCAKGLLRMLQVVRHYVFKKDVEPGTCRLLRKPAPKRTCSNNCDGQGHSSRQTAAGVFAAPAMLAT